MSSKIFFINSHKHVVFNDIQEKYNEIKIIHFFLLSNDKSQVKITRTKGREDNAGGGGYTNTWYLPEILHTL